MNPQQVSQGRSSDSEVLIPDPAASCGNDSGRPSPGREGAEMVKADLREGGHAAGGLRPCHHPAMILPSFRGTDILQQMSGFVQVWKSIFHYTGFPFKTSHQLFIQAGLEKQWCFMGGGGCGCPNWPRTWSVGPSDLTGPARTPNALECPRLPPGRASSRGWQDLGFRRH